MKMRAILKGMIQGVLVSLFVIGVFSAVHAQPTIKKYLHRFDKIKNLLKTPVIGTGGGQIVVNGEIRQVDVSGGSGGCYTITVNAYKIAPNGEKILVRTRSRKLCALVETPTLVLDEIPRGKLIIEIGLDKPGIKDEKFQAELNVSYASEAIKP